MGPVEEGEGGAVTEKKGALSRGVVVNVFRSHLLDLHCQSPFLPLLCEILIQTSLDNRIFVFTKVLKQEQALGPDAHCMGEIVQK